MNKNKFLTIIIIVLLISNGILLFMFFNAPKKHKDPKFYIINKLHFDDAQVYKYDFHINNHRKAVRDNENVMRSLRNQLYSQLKYDKDSLKIDSLIHHIANQQYRAEWINYHHFLEIKNLCKSYQSNDFEELTDEIANLFVNNKRK